MLLPQSTRQKKVGVVFDSRWGYWHHASENSPKVLTSSGKKDNRAVIMVSSKAMRKNPLRPTLNKKKNRQ
ncbi:MAG: hypothetical protein PHR64_02615 [Candidatus Shapirobacteria bacterium]|nr:hypothetical protein [Candidatus Shapirobacteria bacterium]